MRIWSEVDRCFVEVEVMWSATLYREDDVRHSLISGQRWAANPMGRGQRGAPIVGRDMERGAYLARQDVAGKANCDLAWRTAAAARKGP